jgi:hypothetical protein
MQGWRKDEVLITFLGCCCQDQPELLLVLSSGDHTIVVLLQATTLTILLPLATIQSPATGEFSILPFMYFCCSLYLQDVWMEFLHSIKIYCVRRLVHVGNGCAHSFHSYFCELFATLLLIMHRNFWYISY